MGKYRGEERLMTIDAFLKANYPTKGAMYCANELGEKLRYIQSRCHHIQLKIDPTFRTRQRSETSSTMYRKPRNDVGTSRTTLIENRKLKSDNQLLRKQVLKLTMENRRLKAVGGN